MNPHLRTGRPNGPYYHGIVATPPYCEQCPLRFKRKVMPDGPVPARIAFVGEEPGKTEERVGRGFVGPSGNLLWNSFGPACGFNREDVWVTNALLCRAEKVRLETSAVLSKDEVQKYAAVCCFRRLVDELRVVDPVVVIPLGNIALRMLRQSQRAGIYAYRGSRMELDLAAMSDLLHRQSHE